ncbi:MAG: SDR family oxidoreductase [Hyphomicrobium sp.]
MTKYLVTGGQGLLAPYIAAEMAQHGEVSITARACGDCPADLADLNAVDRLVREVRPDIVVHCAAMTDVDRCEREPLAADTANRIATANLVEILPQQSRLVLISTDQVYRDVAGPHAEGDVGPVNTYGASKLAGEREAIRRPDSLVIRTNLFGPSQTSGRQSLSDWMVERIRSGEPTTLFQDSLFSPLHMKSLAVVVAEMIASRLTGVFNVGSRAGMSKADFGLRIAQHLDLPVGNLLRGTASTIAGRARRPRDLRMDVQRIEARLGRPMPDLADEICKL